MDGFSGVKIEGILKFLNGIPYMYMYTHGIPYMYILV